MSAEPGPIDERDGPTVTAADFEPPIAPPIKVGPDDWLVTPDGLLDLAHAVAIVEAYRTLIKAARNHT